ncbi:MAG TPA: hypothetical protein VGM06_10550 [Polyangiaceae bacterium]|jgi:hypothetical protein
MATQADVTAAQEAVVAADAAYNAAYNTMKTAGDAATAARTHLEQVMYSFQQSSGNTPQFQKYGQGI